MAITSTDTQQVNVSQKLAPHKYYQFWDLGFGTTQPKEIDLATLHMPQKWVGDSMNWTFFCCHGEQQRPAK